MPDGFLMKPFLGTGAGNGVESACCAGRGEGGGWAFSQSRSTCFRFAVSRLFAQGMSLGRPQAFGA